MALHNDLGKQSEALAAEYLQGKGYQVVHMNWRYRKAEVDIICKKGTQVIFVEVKARASDRYGLPEEAVSAAKQKMLVDAAEAYSCDSEEDIEIRFDVISIIHSQPLEITHIEEAFTPAW